MAKFSKYLGAAGKFAQDATGVGKQGSRVGEALNAPFVPFKAAGVLGAEALHGAGRLYNKALPVTKKTDPGIANLWSGRREGVGAIAGAAVIGGVYATGSSLNQTTLAPKLGEVSYGGAAPIMNADGVGNTPQAPLSNAPTLGAEGNMVFGLHNARKG